MTKIPDQIPSVLACDVGNTSIHFAVVSGDSVSQVQTLQIGELAGLGERLKALWDQATEPRKIVACSVCAAGLKALEAAAQESLHQEVLLIGRDIPLPMDTDLPQPQAIGVDRLCAAVAAYDRLGVACVVADFGTAITVDCVSEEGKFLGGAILPGLCIGAKALHEYTDQLPLVELTAAPTWVFGKDTHEAIVGGLVLAARGALKELVEAYASELGHWLPVILTGGDAQLVAGSLTKSELVQAIVPDLVLRGVAAAYYRTFVK